MIFKIIDKRTGKEPTQRVINNIARKGELIERDIAGFFVGEDGGLILADECGNYTYMNSMRFAAKISDEAIRQFCKEKHYKIVSERYYNLIHEKLFNYEKRQREGAIKNEKTNN